MVKKYYKEILVSIILIGFISFFVLYLNERQKVKSSEEFTLSVNDSLTKSRNKLNQEISKTELIQSNNVDLLLKIKSKDSSIISLQIAVKEYKNQVKNNGSVTVFGNKTNIDTNIKNKVVGKDTVKIGDIKYVYPEYSYSLDGLFHGWIFGYGRSNKDSTHLSVNIRNEYQVVIGAERLLGIKGYFKPKKQIVIVKNLNPYTTTDYLKSIEIKKSDNRKFIIGPSITYGFDKNLNKGVYFGISVTYKLILF